MPGEPPVDFSFLLLLGLEFERFGAIFRGIPGFFLQVQYVTKAESS